MATALQTSLSKIECSLECSICTHRFRQPKWLSCFHTFCLKCLQELRESRGPQCWKLPCPLCRCETVLNNREVSDLPDNNEMMKIVEELTKQEQIITGKLSEFEDFQKLVSQARRSETAFVVAAKGINSTLEKLGNVFADTKKKISRKADIAVTRIRREEQALKQEAEQVYEDKVKTLTNAQCTNMKMASQAAYHLDRINQLMEGANGSKGTDFKKRLCNDLQEVTRKQPEVVPDSLAFMGFNESDNVSLGKVVQNVQDLKTPRMKNVNGRKDTAQDKKTAKIELKYSGYAEDQWSPLNPEGKKVYSREFLLQFRTDCYKKPEGLPHIPDICLEKANLGPAGSYKSSKKMLRQKNTSAPIQAPLVADHPLQPPLVTNHLSRPADQMDMIAYLRQQRNDDMQYNMSPPTVLATSDNALPVNEHNSGTDTPILAPDASVQHGPPTQWHHGLINQPLFQRDHY